MRLPENFIQEVVERTDIEELIGRYVTLKRTGANYVGRCPFHNEKTPSFTVSPQKKMFYCFGCQAGGSAITFMQKAENMDFAEAVEALANRAGIPMPRDSEGQAKERGTPRKRVLEMNLEAAKFFRACLFDPQYGQAGMEYFKRNRRLSESTIKHFGLGYAPNDFGMLRRHMRQKGYTDDELVDAYLCARSQKNGNVYDIFRNRVMFPIIDTSGNIVAFGGRVLDDSKPKYLNSSDTPAFKKTKHLYALNYAKNVCEEQMILCEGYMDVIALHAAGFEYAVATLGTAITPEHARILSKYTKKVIISYDSDDAGQNAANKAMRLLGEVGIEVRVLKLTGAKDPDEYITKFGAERFRRAVSESRTGFDHKMGAILASHDVTSPDEKIKASKAICAVISEYQSPIERRIYATQAAAALNMPVDIVSNSVEQIRNRRMRDLRKQESREAEASLKKFGDRINPESAKAPGAASAEEAVIGLLLIYEEYRNAIFRGEVMLSTEDFVTEFHRNVFEELMRLHKSESGFHFELLGIRFSPDEIGRIQRCQVARQELSHNGPEVFRSAVEALKNAQRKQQMQEGDLSARLEYLRNKKANLHKGKADTQ